MPNQPHIPPFTATTLTDGVLINSEILGKMSNEDFERFCLEQKSLRIERNEAGELEIMAPAYSETGRINSEINFQLSFWNKQHKLGIVFDSSAGFYLDGSNKSVMRSPDASFIFHERIQSLSAEDRRGFYPLCPDFVIELASSSDSPDHLRSKMERYLAFGASLGWLIIPGEEAVEIFQSGQPPRKIQGFGQILSAEPILPGFSLNLSDLMRK